MNPAGNRPSECAKAVEQIENLDQNENAVCASNSPPSHVLDDLPRVLFTFDLMVSHVLAREVAIADVAVQKRFSTFFIVFVRVFGGRNFLAATKRTIHMFGFELTFLRVFEHLIVPCDVTTFALDLLFIEENFHVTADRSRD